MSHLISAIKKLPRFEGTHTPNQSGHEYIKKIDTGRYVLLEDVLKVIDNNLKNKDKYGYYK